LLASEEQLFLRTCFLLSSFPVMGKYMAICSNRTHSRIDPGFPLMSRRVVVAFVNYAFCFVNICVDLGAKNV
jgi:hypothetical protein